MSAKSAKQRIAIIEAANHHGWVKTLQGRDD